MKNLKKWNLVLKQVATRSLKTVSGSMEPISI